MRDAQCTEYSGRLQWTRTTIVLEPPLYSYSRVGFARFSVMLFHFNSLPTKSHINHSNMISFPIKLLSYQRNMPSQLRIFAPTNKLDAGSAIFWCAAPCRHSEKQQMKKNSFFSLFVLFSSSAYLKHFFIYMIYFYEISMKEEDAAAKKYDMFFAFAEWH